MINLLLGPPGGGKSYEAVVYHILPALEAGRKVITNLPLDLQHISQVNKDYIDLIDLRFTTKKDRPVVDWEKSEQMFKKFGIAQKQSYFINAPFAHVEDYGDPWRHPETGSGPLYVVDECHIPLPGRGTEMEVEHWYSLHRHESADVLLITQSYGKINRAILDLVQICYRVKKNTSMGSNKTYVRKVQDGVRGEVVNTGIRKYEKQFFPFYKSHTRGGGAELAAEDIVPIWFRWPFIGSALCAIIFIALVIGLDIKNPMNPKSYNKVEESEQIIAKLEAIAPSDVRTHGSTPKVENKQTQQGQITATTPVKKEKPVDEDPFGSNGIHIVGHVTSKERTLWIVSLSQNGQGLKNINAEDLVKIGYKFEPINDCGAWLEYKKVRRFIKCDSPSISPITKAPDI